MENSEFGNGLIVGWIVSGIIFTVLGFALTKPTEELKSTTKIVPEKVLTTDGKKVDTIYVYKINQK